MNDLDWGSLDQVINPDATKYRFADVAHLFRKVAFDVYKPLTGIEQLWELRAGDDGESYLYALYGDSEDLTVKSEDKTGPWQATSDRTGENVTLSYKNIPIMRFASEKEGFKKAEARDFAAFLETRIQDKDFMDTLVANLPPAKSGFVAELLSADQ